MADTRVPDFKEVKAELLRRIERLARECAPGGHKNNGYYFALNPTRADKRIGSFYIKLSGHATGAWEDRATGDKGDVIDYVTYCMGLSDRKATLHWCLDWLGWRAGIDRKTLETKRKDDRYLADQDDRLQREELATKRRKAKAWWLAAQPTIEGTLAETYLRFRGVEIARLAHPPRALRFLPKAEHRDRDGVITDWPCLIAAMTDAAGQIIAVHRTFLAADGRGKAPVEPQKKIWPHGWQGAVIRLAKGAGKLAPEEAVKRNPVEALPLLIAEGIENGLSLALACPDYRVWAAGTLGNIAQVPVDHPCVSRVIVFADNDAGEHARSQLDKAVAALRCKRPVTVARSFAGKDANDFLRGIS
jgi:hypothetical protein